MRQRFGSALILTLASVSCENPLGGSNGDDSVPLQIVSLPPGDTLHQAGVAFTFSRAPLGVLSRIEVSIEGVPTFVQDSLWTVEAPTQVPVFVHAKIPNGRHTFRLRAV